MVFYSERRETVVTRWSHRSGAPWAALLVVGLLAACKSPDPSSTGGAGSAGGAGGQGVVGSDYPSAAVAAPYDVYFDPPASNGKYTDDYAVVGSITPPSFSWGKIELLEGHQAYREEGYNLRTAKLRYQDTFQDKDYPLQTYFGEQNQELVDGFNVYYKDACAGKAGGSGAPACPTTKSPTRPEARFVLLQIGPKTAAKACDATKTPVLLVHGSLQNGNVWISPGGDDGKGNAYPGTAQKTGFVQALEAAGTCAYAVTFGNFHGDNFNQATNLANAIRRVKELTGRPKVDIIAWSKGGLSADVYLSDVATWKDWGPHHFEALAAEQAKRVPAFRKDVRAYIALSSPHLGIDLNFRHPFDDLVIFSTAESAPIGQAPVVWGFMSAIQCVTWGPWFNSPQSVFPNASAYSVCEKRGGDWTDYWNRIYTSNITGLDAEGKPTHDKSLKDLNATAPASGLAKYDFDKYNISMWGAVDDAGKFVSAYLGQLQVAYDLRTYYPTPDRTKAPVGDDWSKLDTDENKWRKWAAIKLAYNTVPAVAGVLLDDAGHTDCRNTAFDPQTRPCKADHTFYNAATAEGQDGFYWKYRMMDGIGIKAVAEMGGNFIERLKHHGLSQGLDYLYVLYGTSAGTGGTPFEIDGMKCPASGCDTHGDGVLFDVSIAAQDQLTQGWSAADKAGKSKQEGMAFGHLDMGVTPAVWTRMMDQLKAVP